MLIYFTSRKGHASEIISELDSDIDLVISVGGDGSFLRMVKDNNFNSDIYYIGVNSGTLGFLQEIDIKDTDGREVKKMIIRYGALQYYPSGMRIYGHSRNLGSIILSVV